MEKFCLNSYDCVGFDLDNTAAEYNTPAQMKMEYDILANFLVTHKGYDGKFLKKPFISDFLLKGLFMDMKKGNLVKLGCDGVVLRASHGTSMLSEKEISSQYGVNKIWADGAEYVKDPVAALREPLSNTIRSFLDAFDLPSVLVFARIVDSIDAKAGKVVGNYNIWPDILEGLYDMFTRYHFAKEIGGFFPEIKKNQHMYYKKTSQATVDLLKKLKKTKFTYLLTGSYPDFANQTATFALGENWKDLFDVVIYFGRKPLFFFKNSPFLQIKDNAEADPVPIADLQLNSAYSQGNWRDLMLLMKKKIKVAEPKCLYVGDNSIQDVFAPVKYNCCDTLAVFEECKELDDTVNVWGSFWKDDAGIPFWSHIIKTNAKLCIPSLDVLSSHSIDFKFSKLQTCCKI